MVEVNKFSNPKRFAPDYQVTMDHERAFMRETNANQYGYIKGELYDELLAEYRKVARIGTLKSRIVRFLGKHIWKLIITYCVGAFILLVWLITLIV